MKEGKEVKGGEMRLKEGLFKKLKEAGSKEPPLFYFARIYKMHKV